MTKPTNRGSAPGRARPEDQRPGSFKPGHEKLGGRKRGTPNAITLDLKKAIIEAANRFGYDGNGKYGIVGYFMWVARYRQDIYVNGVLSRLLPLEDRDTPLYDPALYASEVVGNLMALEAKDPGGDMSAALCDIEDVNQSVRERIGITSKKGTEKQTEQDRVGFLMQLAVEDPKEFCKLYIAALRPPRRPRRPAPGCFRPHA
jgi:hypothetical protein